MGKGENTRQAIVERAASLFNERGYAASMQEVTDATGLKKGGVYNHFESKEALAAESFEYAVGRNRAGFERIETIADPVARLGALATRFAERYTGEAPFPHGCVVLNTAIEAKHHMPELRERAQAAMREFLGVVERAVRQGVAGGVFAKGTRAPEVASIFVSTLEGAMLLAMLYDDREPLRRAVRHLEWYVEQLRAPASEPGSVSTPRAVRSPRRRRS